MEAYTPLGTHPGIHLGRHIHHCTHPGIPPWEAYIPLLTPGYTTQGGREASFTPGYTTQGGREASQDLKNSLITFVGESRTEGRPETALYSRFTVGHTPGLPCSAHLSTLCQEERHPAARTVPPRAPTRFTVGHSLNMLGEVYPTLVYLPGMSPCCISRYIRLPARYMPGMDHHEV